MSEPLQMTQSYLSVFSQPTIFEPLEPYTGPIVIDQDQVPMDHSQFFNEQVGNGEGDAEFDAPPNHLPDAYGYDYSAG